MALSDRELQKWKKLFYNLDFEKSGFVNIIHLFRVLEEPYTEFAKDIFVSVDALDPESDGIYIIDIFTDLFDHMSFISYLKNPIYTDF
jgi:Ca2+-binding EF-hand superfamily protein